jgi:hypothetical protein
VVIGPGDEDVSLELLPEDDGVFGLLGLVSGLEDGFPRGGGVLIQAQAQGAWGNTLTVTSASVTLDLKGKPKTHFEIPSQSITGLSYGQEAHRRVGTMIALAVLVAPLALFGLFHKTRLHYIGVQYKLADGTTGGILLQGDKSNYRAMLVALQGVSGAAVSVSDKEREYIPVGVKAETKPEVTKTEAK